MDVHLPERVVEMLEAYLLARIAFMVGGQAAMARTVLDAIEDAKPAKEAWRD